jgi:hypothetical protein
MSNTLILSRCEDSIYEPKVTCMNHENDEDKVGLIGEYLVKIRLNSYGVNTGNVRLPRFDGQKIGSTMNDQDP